jgi:acetyl esterase/lipase
MGCGRNREFAGCVTANRVDLQLKSLNNWFMQLFRFTLILIGLSLLSGCAVLTKRIKRTEDLAYISETSLFFNTERHRLDVYAPRKKEELKEVLVFIHGGSWNSGGKSIYKFLGRRFARKGVVTVVINYRLSPGAEYNEMAMDAARAVKWVQEEIETFGGNPEKIFVSGHSAGGHLAALISIKDQYFDSLGISNPVNGAVLIDAAGLDMYTYLKEHQSGEGKMYLETFTKNPGNWKEASPIYYLNENMPPLLIYRGGKTYPSIIKSNEAFVKELKKFVPEPNYKIQKGKKHVPMIIQFICTLNPRYKEILRFMENPAADPFSN